MKKILPLLLAILMIMALVACQNGGGDTTETKAPTVSSGGGDVVTEPETEAVTELLDFLPNDLNYDGQTFVILQCQAYGTDYGNEVCLNFEEVVPGDRVSESVYKRGVKLYDALGIELEDVMGSAWDTWNNDVYTAVNSGEYVYDAVCGAPCTAYRCAVEGSIINLTDLDSIDLTHTWWDRQEMKNMTFGQNYLYTLSGDINFYDNYATSCILFNKTLFKDSGLEEPYQTVEDGTWTFDKLTAMCAEFYDDLDHDQQKSLGDKYGFVSNNAAVGRFLRAFQKPQVTVDDDNWPTVDTGEEIVNAIDKMLDDLFLKQGAYTDKGGGEYANIFYQGRALFSEDNMAALVATRSRMNDDPGILPYPKYDEEQENYCCPISEPYASVYGIVSNADWERAGYVLDTMGALSVETVTEEVIEKYCMVRAVKDEESERMLRIIFKTAYYPMECMGQWGQFYNIPAVVGWELENVYYRMMMEQIENVNIMITNDMTALRNPKV